MAISETSSKEFVNNSRDEEGGYLDSSNRRRTHKRFVIFRRIGVIIRRIFSTIATASATVIAGVICALLIESTLYRNTIDLNSFSVPKKSSDDGFASEVVTNQLRDAIKNIYQRADTSMAGADAGGRLTLTGINIPGSGMSLADMAAFLRRLLPDSWKNEISGEFTFRGDHLHLRMRHNGKIIFDDVSAESSNFSYLINRAANHLVRKIQPFMSARALLKDGNIDEASIEADIILISLPPEDENVRRVWFLKGAIAESKQMYEEAIAFYRKAPYPSIVHSNVGFIKFKQGDDLAAEAEYKTSIKHDNKYPLVYNNLGLLLISRGRYEEAESILKKAIELNQELPLPYYNIGCLYLNSNKYDEAEAAFQQALRISPNLAGVHYHRGVSFHKRGMIEQAESSYKKAISLDFSFDLARNDLGLLFQEAGLLDKAEEEYKTLLGMHPSFALGRYNFAKLLHNKGLINEAEVEYRKAGELNKSFALVHYNLSIILLGKNEIKEAKIEYEKALSIDPSLSRHKLF